VPVYEFFENINFKTLCGRKGSRLLYLSQQYKFKRRVNIMNKLQMLSQLKQNTLTFKSLLRAIERFICGVNFTTWSNRNFMMNLINCLIMQKNKYLLYWFIYKSIFNIYKTILDKNSFFICLKKK